MGHIYVFITYSKYDYNFIFCLLDIFTLIFPWLYLKKIASKVTNYNDITHHFLQAIYAHLQISKARLFFIHWSCFEYNLYFISYTNI